MKCSNYKKKDDEDDPDLKERYDQGLRSERKGSNVSHLGSQGSCREMTSKETSSENTWSSIRSSFHLNLRNARKHSLTN